MGEFFIVLNQNIHCRLITFVIRTANEANEEGQNPASVKARKSGRRRHHKGDADLLEQVPLKYRRFISKMKRKVNKDLKRMQILPYEILQLEEIVGGANPLKIKLYTLSNEHLGYPCDLRSNFLFDPSTFFLKIDHTDPAIALHNSSLLAKG